jgi:cardiolipin synthase (CMP-forming)
MSLKYIPNVITLFRVILIWPFILFLLQKEYVLGFYVFLLAGLSDAVDGFLARYFGWSSWTGALVDPLADKMLMIASFVLLAVLEQLPWGIVYLFILRDLVIVVGAAAYYYLFRNIVFQPIGLSKVNTFLQVILAALLLYQLAYETVAAWFISSMIWVTLVMTVLTMLQYVWVWSLKTRQDWIRRVEKQG